MLKLKNNLNFSLYLLLIFLLIGCRPYSPYKEDKPELFTVAIHSLLGTRGHTPEYHGYVPVDIKVLEEDSYGRVLFAYCEDQIGTITSLLIVQKFDDDYSYFYPDNNFISKNASHLYYYDPTVYNNSNPLRYAIDIFTDEDIILLKQLNDWEKPIDESKCIKTEITRQKEVPEIFKKKKDKEKTFKILCKIIQKEFCCECNASIYRNEIYLCSDDYGRVLYYVYGVHIETKNRCIYPNSITDFNMVVILNPNGSYNNFSIMKLENMYNYQNDLVTFKESNNWNIDLG